MKNVFLLFAITFSLINIAFAQPSKPVKPVSAAIIKMREAIDSAMDTQEYALALKKCDALLKTSPGDSVAMQRKVGAFFYLNKFDECIAQTPRAFKNQDTAAYMLGYLSLQDQDENNDSASVWASRNKLANAGLKLNPKDAYCNASKSILMSESGNTDSSYIYIDEAVKYGDAETKPWARVIKAALYHDNEKQQQCYDELKSIINDFPEYGKAYIQLVQIYRGDKMYAEAMDALAAHSKKFSAEQENKDLEFYILRDWGKKEEACNVSKEIGEENSYIFDEAIKLGCSWMYATLQNSDGGTYIYAVDYNGADYDFVVNKTGGSYNGNSLDFKWNMTSDDDMHGTIILTKDALDTAHEQLNEISKGDITLTDKTSVWISRSVFNELTAQGEAYINADGETRLYKVATQEDEDNYLVDNYTPSILYNGEKGKTVKMIHIYADDDSGYGMWIYNDANNPQIIKMNIGWTIELKEVKE